MTSIYKGYIVLAASNSLDALSLAAESDVIDAIVCDVVLPDLSGPELAASVGALGFDAAVVFVSGYDRELLASRGMLPRHAQVIQKPFTQETLLAAVGAAIAARSAR